MVEINAIQDKLTLEVRVLITRLEGRLDVPLEHIERSCRSKSGDGCSRA